MKNKKLWIGVLSMVLLAGCDNTKASASESSYPSTLDNVVVWSAEDTVKVLSNQKYEELYQEASISLSAVKNEYENAQIIMTPTRDVKAYNVTLNDLKNENNTTFSANNFNVYHQKYIEVTRTTTNRFQAGFYPDALLPLSVAIEYKENQIKANHNQGIYFECYVPKGQQKGTYSGEFILTLDGDSMSIPVSLTVYDYTLSDTVHSRSSFGIHRYWNEGGIVTAEKDASYDMYAKYYDYLLEHRVSARYLPASMDDISGFIDQLKKYGQNEKVSNYILPYVSKYDSSFSGTGIDYDLYERQFDAIIDLCVKDNYNYLAKASTYFAMFDEITASSAITMANAFYKKILDLHFKLAKKYETSLTCDPMFKNELIDSLLNINQLMVTSYNERFANQVTFCPLLNQYDNAQAKEKYQDTYVIEDPTSDYTIRQNQEKWWYSAGIPKNPYASYHIDDNGYSPIVYSWMQYANQVVGNLYWSATFYLVRTTENNKIVYQTLQDCYTTAMRFPSTNGDGFLVYPGAPYGISGPVGSIRLQQILDGLEEYDMLYALQSQYDNLKANGVNCDYDEVMSFFYNQLFSGTKVSTTNQIYEEMRVRLIELLTLATQEGIVITSAKLTADALNTTVYVPSNKTVQFNGETTKVDTLESGASIHHVTMNLQTTKSDFVITTQNNKARLQVDGKYLEYSGNDLNQLFNVSNGTCSYDENGATMVFAASSDSRHSFRFESTLIDQIQKNLSSIEMKLNVSVNTNVEILFTGSLMSAAIPVYTGVLVAGDNNISMNISTLNFETMGDITGVIIRLGETGENTARTVIVRSIVYK